MTVSNPTTVVSAIGNGVTTVFPYTFLIPEGTHEVTLTTLSTGVEGDPLTEGVDYSITGEDDPAGGNVTYPLIGSALASTHKINIRRQMSVEQTLDLTSQSAYDPATLEQQLDDIVMVQLNHAEELARAVKSGTGATQSAQDFLEQAQEIIAAINGPQDLWITADEMVPQSTNGAARVTVELPVNKLVLSTLDFDDTTQEFALYYLVLPTRWNAGTLTARFFWTAAMASGAGAVRWGMEARGSTDEDVLDAAYGSDAEASGNTINDAYELQRSDATAAMTAAGSVGSRHLLVIRFYRRPASGEDTLVGDAKLIGVQLTWTSDAANDA